MSADEQTILAITRDAQSLMNTLAYKVLGWSKDEYASITGRADPEIPSLDVRRTLRQLRSTLDYLDLGDDEDGDERLSVEVAEDVELEPRSHGHE